MILVFLRPNIYRSRKYRIMSLFHSYHFKLFRIWFFFKIENFWMLIIIFNYLLCLKFLKFRTLYLRSLAKWSLIWIAFNYFFIFVFIYRNFDKIFWIFGFPILHILFLNFLSSILKIFTFIKCIRFSFSFYWLTTGYNFKLS